MQTPQNEIIERINGFAVIAAIQLQHDNGVEEAVVVCDRAYHISVEEAWADRYAVWTVNTRSGQAFWGFYTDDRAAALNNALERTGWNGLKGYRKPKAA